MDKQFEQSIALECRVLEDTFSTAMLDYHNTASLRGKSWYAIGLESNDRDQQHDQAAKSGVVSRMVDAIKAFIKRIVDFVKRVLDKIKAGVKKIFGKDELKADVAIKTIEEYEASLKKRSKTEAGISVNLSKFLAEYKQRMAEAKTADEKDYAVSLVRTAVRLELNNVKNTKEDLQHAWKTAATAVPDMAMPYKEEPFAREIQKDKSKWTEAVFSVEVVSFRKNFSKERFDHLIEMRDYLARRGADGFADSTQAPDVDSMEDAGLKKLISKLGEGHAKLICVMFTPQFADAYGKVFMNVVNMKARGMDAEENQKFVEPLNKALEEVKKLKEELLGKVGEYQVLRDWLVDGKAEIGKLAARYARSGSGLDEAIGEVPRHMSELEQDIKSLDGDQSAESVARLKSAQEVLKALAAYIGFAGPIVATYHAFLAVLYAANRGE